MQHSSIVWGKCRRRGARFNRNGGWQRDRSLKYNILFPWDPYYLTRIENQLNVIGPNCLGILNPEISLNCSFAKDIPIFGDVALISQSGAVIDAIIDWSFKHKIGFSKTVLRQCSGRFLFLFIFWTAACLPAGRP